MSDDWHVDTFHLSDQVPIMTSPWFFLLFSWRCSGASWSGALMSEFDQFKKPSALKVSINEGRRECLGMIWERKLVPPHKEGSSNPVVERKLHSPARRTIPWLGFNMFQHVSTLHKGPEMIKTMEHHPSGLGGWVLLWLCWSNLWTYITNWDQQSLGTPHQITACDSPQNGWLTDMYAKVIACQKRSILFLGGTWGDDSWSCCLFNEATPKILQHPMKHFQSNKGRSV